MVFKSGRAFQRGVRRSMYEPQPRTLAEPKQHQQNGQRLHKLRLGKGNRRTKPSRGRDKGGQAGLIG
jgi:hypothetical protein